MPTSPSISESDKWDSIRLIPLSPNILRDASWFEDFASKGNEIFPPENYPEARWEGLSIPEKSLFLAQWRHSPEYAEFLKTEAQEQEQPEEDIHNIEQFQTSHSRVYIPPHIVEGDGKTIGDVWKAIMKIYENDTFPDLPAEDSKNLWAVYTNRPGKLMLIIISKRDLEKYLGAICPITIRNAPGYMSLLNEAQSLSGWAKIGGAANAIGRLAYFRATPTVQNDPKSIDPTEVLS
jgi:hypothetical protein